MIVTLDLEHVLTVFQINLRFSKKEKKIHFQTYNDSAVVEGLQAEAETEVQERLSRRTRRLRPGRRPVCRVSNNERH